MPHQTSDCYKLMTKSMATVTRFSLLCMCACFLHHHHQSNRRSSRPSVQNSEACVAVGPALYQTALSPTQQVARGPLNAIIITRSSGSRNTRPKIHRIESSKPSHIGFSEFAHTPLFLTHPRTPPQKLASPKLSRSTPLTLPPSDCGANRSRASVITQREAAPIDT